MKAPECEGAAPEPVKDSSPSTAPSSKKKNLPKVSQEQLDRIKASRIEPMGHVNPPLSADDQFFNTIAPYVHDSQVDAQPMSLYRFPDGIVQSTIKMAKSTVCGGPTQVRQICQRGD